jgi:hypothetical protein
MKKYFLYFVALNFSLSACTSQTLIRNKDYSDSVLAFKSGQPEDALQFFPKQEDGGFITTIEKSWLRLWTHKSEDPKKLLQLSQSLDERNFTRISRETEYFFYSETEEGYIPAEHEVIILHLLAATYFIKEEKWDSARVEAKRATFFIQSYVKDVDKVAFDDPALRLWLGSLWAALGEWEEAKVDFRRASTMTGDKRLEKLAQRAQYRDTRLGQKVQLHDSVL